MRSSVTMAKDAGWQEVTPGIWAREAWRIQRLSRGWSFHYVVGAGLPGRFAGVRGKSPTLRGALQAVALIADGAA